MAHQIAPAICTTEQDAAHCGPKGTGLSSSSHLHHPLQCLADPNGLWGRLPPHSEMPAEIFLASFALTSIHQRNLRAMCPQQLQVFGPQVLC